MPRCDEPRPAPTHGDEATCLRLQGRTLWQRDPGAAPHSRGPNDQPHVVAAALPPAGRGSGCSDLPISPVPAPCLPPGGVCSCIPPRDATRILPSPAGEQNKPAARQDRAPSRRHGHPAELGSAPVLRQLPGSPGGIWGAVAWPAFPAEPVPFPQKEESGSRFNLESLKSQTRCRHRQVGTGRAVAWHRGPPGIPTGVPGP